MVMGNSMTPCDSKDAFNTSMGSLGSSRSIVSNMLTPHMQPVHGPSFKAKVPWKGACTEKLASSTPNQRMPPMGPGNHDRSCATKFQPAWQMAGGHLQHPKISKVPVLHVPNDFGNRQLQSALFADQAAGFPLAVWNVTLGRHKLGSPHLHLFGCTALILLNC